MRVPVVMVAAMLRSGSVSGVGLTIPFQGAAHVSIDESELQSLHGDNLPFVWVVILASLHPIHSYMAATEALNGCSCRVAKRVCLIYLGNQISGHGTTFGVRFGGKTLVKCCSASLQSRRSCVDS